MFNLVFFQDQNESPFGPWGQMFQFPTVSISSNLEYLFFISFFWGLHFHVILLWKSPLPPWSCVRKFIKLWKCFPRWIQLLMVSYVMMMPLAFASDFRQLHWLNEITNHGGTPFAESVMIEMHSWNCPSYQNHLPSDLLCAVNISLANFQVLKTLKWLPRFPVDSPGLFFWSSGWWHWSTCEYCCSTAVIGRGLAWLSSPLSMGLCSCSTWAAKLAILGPICFLFCAINVA